MKIIKNILLVISALSLSLGALAVDTSFPNDKVTMWGDFGGITLDVKLIGGEPYDPLYQSMIPIWEERTGGKVKILSKKSHFELDKEIKVDIVKTKRKWKEILKQFKENGPHGILHQEDNIIDSILREFLIDTTKEIEFNSRKTYNYFKKNLKKNQSNIKLKIVSKKEDIFKRNNIDKDIEKIFHKKVNLKN